MTEWWTTRSMAAAVAIGLAKMRSHSEKTRFDALGMRDYIWRYPRGSYIQERWFDLGNPGLTCRVAVNIMRSIVPSSVFHPSGSRPRESDPLPWPPGARVTPRLLTAVPW